jgi:hypothetical protein
MQHERKEPTTPKAGRAQETPKGTKPAKTGGRPGKLTDWQWGEIGRRLANGETTTALAKEFKVSKSLVSGRFSNKVEALKSLASQIVEVECAYERLPVSEQCSVRTIADHLKAIGNNLATAANFGTASAARLAEIAHGKVAKLDAEQPDPDELKGIAALTAVSNAAANVGTVLVNANRNRMEADDERTQTTQFEADEARRLIYAKLLG